MYDEQCVVLTTSDGVPPSSNTVINRPFISVSICFSYYLGNKSHDATCCLPRCVRAARGAFCTGQVEACLHSHVGTGLNLDATIDKSYVPTAAHATVHSQSRDRFVAGFFEALFEVGQLGV